MDNKSIFYDVGQVLEHKGVKLEVVESRSCHGCYYNSSEAECDNSPDCEDNTRLDGRSVIFKEVEKVGGDVIKLGNISIEYRNENEVYVTTKGRAVIKCFANNLFAINSCDKS